MCGHSVQETSSVLRGEVLAIWALLYHQLHHTHHLARYRQAWATAQSNECSNNSEPVTQAANVSFNKKRTSATHVAHNETMKCNSPEDRRLACVESMLSLPTRDYSSGALQQLVFSSHKSSLYTFSSHTYHSIPETQTHRTMRLCKAAAKKPKIEEIDPSPSTTDGSGASQSLTEDPTMKETADDTLNTSICQSGGEEESLPPPAHLPYLFHPTITRSCQPTYLPPFLTYTCPKVVSGRRYLYSYDHHSRMWQRHMNSTYTMATLRHGVQHVLSSTSGMQQSSKLCSSQDTDRAGINVLIRTPYYNKIIIPGLFS